MMRSSKPKPTVAKFIAPMKALGSAQVPTGCWRCEIKFDGYRAVAVLNGQQVELWSRNRNPLNDDYPEVIAALAKLKCRNAVLDGEIVALDAAGRSRFQLLQGRGVEERPLIAFYIFDIMQLDGKEISTFPLEARQRILAALLKNSRPPLQLSPWFDVEPAELMQAARRQGLEGVIAKRPGSAYESGRRSGAWMKCKVLGEQEFVIGGFSAPQRGRNYFGAILVGYYCRGKLLYAGKVGTGFNRQLLQTLYGDFMKRQSKTCPFANLPMQKKPRFGRGMTRSEMKKVTWIAPKLVAQIKFAEWTNDGLLRQPVFLGLRNDKSVREIRREASA